MVGELLVAWIGLPILAVVISVGLALLLERLTGYPLGVLRVPVGLCSAVCLTLGVYWVKGPAVIAVAVLLLGALAGLVLGRGELVRMRPGWLSLAWVVAYCLHLAPVLLSGDAAWAGYNFVNDTATQMVLAEYVSENGVGESRRDVAHDRRGVRPWIPLELLPGRSARAAGDPRRGGSRTDRRPLSAVHRGADGLGGHRLGPTGASRRAARLGRGGGWGGGRGRQPPLPVRPPGQRQGDGLPHGVRHCRRGGPGAHRGRSPFTGEPGGRNLLRGGFQRVQRRCCPLPRRFGCCARGSGALAARAPAGKAAGGGRGSVTCDSSGAGPSRVSPAP